MKNVIAVVVTHNRYHSLVNCIEAIRSQTIRPNQIVVINNGSSDYSSVWLDQQEDIIHLYQDNTGSSGGFHKGISWSYQNDYKWIWCMEDDSYPHENALEKLLMYGLKEKSLVCSLLINNANDHSTNINPFNGALLHHSIISKAGLPKSNLFCNGAESEYYYRITKKNGFGSKRIAESLHFHDSSPTDFNKEWNMKTCWPLYFQIRNQYIVYQSKYNNKPLAFCKYLSFVYSFICLIAKTQHHNKTNKYAFVYSAMIDALRANYEATANTIQARVNRKTKNSFFENVLFPIRSFVLQHFVPSFSETHKTA